MADKKENLTKAIKAMFLLLGLSFIFILLSSISGPRKITHHKNPFDNVETGETAARRLGAIKVWATRLSARQRTQASRLDQYVVDANSGCDLASEVCVLIAATKRSGIDIIFTEQPPKLLKSSTPWFGGFVDPTTGEAFDRLGRAYKFNQASVSKEFFRDELTQLKRNN